MLKAIKVRLHSTVAQRQTLACQLGTVRWAYNFALKWRMKARSERDESVTKRMTLNRLVELKASEGTTWLGGLTSRSFSSR